MAETYDWTGFYQALCAQGPLLLVGLSEEEGERELVVGLAADTDSFWSDGLEDLLAGGAAEGDLRAGVLAALELWRENVLTELSGTYGFDVDWGAVTIDTDSPLVDTLVEAASGTGSPPNGS